MRVANVDHQRQLGILGQVREAFERGLLLLAWRVIVTSDAELARTKITDTGLKTLATFANLRTVDLAHTAVTSAGVPILARLSHLQSLNLTATAVDDTGVASLRRKQTLKRLYLFETKCTAQSELESRDERP